jgi:tetratricopeptide (TPR) repeat protein
LIRLQQARFGAAADLFRQALKIERRSVDALHHLAVALSGLERYEEAIRLYDKTLSMKPDHPEAHNNLAHSLQMIGRNEQAIIHYEKALTIKPGYVEARNNLGAVLQTLGRIAEAIPHYKMALAARPDYAAAHKNMGNALGALNRHQEATIYFGQALALNPDDIEAHIGLGNALLKLDQPREAIASFEKVRALNPGYVDALNGLGSAAHMLGRSEEAILHYQAALTINPASIEAHSKIGDALLALGRLKDANTAMERALALAPRKAGYYWNLANARRFTENDPHLVAMRELTHQLQSLNEEEQIDLHFALGNAYGDLAAHSQSFQHVLQGNALMRQRVAYDEANALGRFERMRKIFTPGLMNGKKGLGDPSAVPVFVVGMPRSGTTRADSREPPESFRCWRAPRDGDSHRAGQRSRRKFRARGGSSNVRRAAATPWRRLFGGDPATGARSRTNHR